MFARLANIPSLGSSYLPPFDTFGHLMTLSKLPAIPAAASLKAAAIGISAMPVAAAPMAAAALPAQGVVGPVLSDLATTFFGPFHGAIGVASQALLNVGMQVAGAVVPIALVFRYAFKLLGFR
jgi:hypothetical protein